MFEYVPYQVGFKLTASPKHWELNPRQGTMQPRWLCHRFPIKNGAGIHQVLIDHAMRSTNSLVENLEKRLFG